MWNSLLERGSCLWAYQFNLYFLFALWAHASFCVYCMILFTAEEVVVPDTLLEELADLRVAFAQLLCKYEKELRNSPDAQEEFVEFLPRLLRNRKGFSSDQSFQSNFDKLIDEEVSLFNIHYLKRICSIFSEEIW